MKMKAQDQRGGGRSSGRERRSNRKDIVLQAFVIFTWSIAQPNLAMFFRQSPALMSMAWQPMRRKFIARRSYFTSTTPSSHRTLRFSLNELETLNTTGM